MASEHQPASPRHQGRFPKRHWSRNSSGSSHQPLELLTAVGRSRWNQIHFAFFFLHLHTRFSCVAEALLCEPNNVPRMFQMSLVFLSKEHKLATQVQRDSSVVTGLNGSDKQACLLITSLSPRRSTECRSLYQTVELPSCFLFVLFPGGCWLMASGAASRSDESPTSSCVMGETGGVNRGWGRGSAHREQHQGPRLNLIPFIQVYMRRKCCVKVPGRSHWLLVNGHDSCWVSITDGTVGAMQ